MGLSLDEIQHPETWQLQCLVSPFPKIFRSHNATVTPGSPVSVTEAPFGLPPCMTIEEYRADPICRLSLYNYKLEAKIGTSRASQQWRLTVLDSGAGPNLIRAALLSPETISSLDTKREVVNLASASNHRLDVLGIVILTVTVGTQTNRVPFVVVKQLGADAILGCSYMDQAIEDIKCQKRGVLLLNGDFVPVTRRRASAPLCHGLPESKLLGNRAKTHHNALRCAKWTKLAPLTETMIPVTCSQAGLRLLEPMNDLYTKRRISIANGLAEVKPGVPIFVRIANFSDSTVTLPKNMRIGYTVPAPLSQKVLTVTFEDDPATHDNREQEHLFSKPSDSENLRGGGGDAPTPFTVDDIDLSELTPIRQNTVRKMLKPFTSMWHGKLGEVKITEHRIDLVPGARPVFSQPYRAGAESRKVIQKNVDELLQQGIIEPTKSQWASPVVLAPKADGSLRFCIDYRRLNTITKKDSYPLPRMDDCLDSLGTAKFFSTLDCNSGYWQVKVANDDKHKTAFTSHAGTFQWNRMPFGLCNAPATFQRTLDILLAGLRWKTCLVYLDDVIIFSNSFEEHVQHVREVLSALQTAGLSLKLKKCKLFSATVDYLGHVIRPGKLAVAEKNTDAIKMCSYPSTQTQLRSFLGMCNVYRRFVPCFARVAAPLNKLLCKGQSPQLPEATVEQRDSFETLKKALINPPILRLPQPDREYSVDTDACADQIGCALMQTSEDGTRYPVGFWSRSLLPAERNYSASERECLAVIWAVQILRPYLERKHFTLYTDHSALKWMFDLVDVSGRLARWRLRLLEFDFTIKYRKGADNVVADAISRLPTFGFTRTGPDLDIPCFLVEDKETASAEKKTITSIVDKSNWLNCDWDPCDHALSDHADRWRQEKDIPQALSAEVSLLTIDEIREAQLADPLSQKTRSAISQGKQTPYTEDDRGLIVRVAPVDHSIQIFIPEALRPRALYLAHYTPVSGHPGISRQYYTMRRTFYWPSMISDIQKMCKDCHTCAKERTRLRSHQSPMKLFPATEPLEFVAIDILGPLPRSTKGHQYILVITDRFTKLTRVTPLHSITAIAVAKAFIDDWVFSYGAPARLLSDNGSQFTAKLFQSACAQLGIKNVFTTAYHPQTNGQTERFNRTLLAGLRAFASEHPKTWHEYAGAVAYAYNTQVHKTTGLTPFELVLSRPPPPTFLKREPNSTGAMEPRLERRRFTKQIQSFTAVAAARTKSAQLRYKRDHDARIKPLQAPQPGDQVYVQRQGPSEDAGTGERRLHKLQAKADGPYPVISATSHTVTIDRNGLLDTITRNRISKAPDAQSLAQASSSTEPVALSGVDLNGSVKILRRARQLRNTTDNASIKHPTHTPTPQVTDTRAVRTTMAPNPPQEYVVDKIITYDSSKDVFRVRWHGFKAAADTWEPPSHLPFNMMMRYFRRSGIPLPSKLLQYRRTRQSQSSNEANRFEE